VLGQGVGGTVKNAGRGLRQAMGRITVLLGVGTAIGINTAEACQLALALGFGVVGPGLDGAGAGCAGVINPAGLAAQGIVP
jgi:hypothetical protein